MPLTPDSKQPVPNEIRSITIPPKRPSFSANTPPLEIPSVLDLEAAAFETTAPRLTTEPASHASTRPNSPSCPKDPETAMMTADITCHDEIHSMRINCSPTPISLCIAIDHETDTKLHQQGTVATGTVLSFFKACSKTTTQDANQASETKNSLTK